jgi:ABC-type transport system involved in multi-copper enzyme maturation permease subunit
MVTLIAREIRDHLVYVLACCSLSAIMVGIMVSAYFWEVKTAIYLFPPALAPVLFFGLAALGSSQMYSDRANRLSALLSTLAVTRSRILAARVVVGVLTVFAALAPLLVTALILLALAGPPAHLYSRMMWEMAVSIALTAFACYCVGLEVGWTTNKTWLLVGNLVLVGLVTSLVVSKGFGLDAVLLLLLLAAAMLLHVWHRFTSAAL